LNNCILPDLLHHRWTCLLVTSNIAGTLTGTHTLQPLIQLGSMNVYGL
jgi:hypothetical protein